MSEHRLRRTRRLRVAAAFCVALFVGLGLSACSGMLGGHADASLSNHDKQKKSVDFFLSVNPGVQVEKIRFTDDGAYSGAGTWGVPAVVTVQGKEYHETLGYVYGPVGGDPMPGDNVRTAPPGATRAGVVVIYSDGTSEVLK